jgi:Zn-dependent protease with chaperone function
MARGDGRRRGGGGLVLLALLGALLAPLAAILLRLAISRQREYLADASGALLTRYPDGLARALEKIAAAARPLVLRDAECFAGRFVDDENCLMATDADEFSSHLRRLAEEPELRVRLGDEARRFAAAHSLEQVGSRLREIYARLS